MPRRLYCDATSLPAPRQTPSPYYAAIGGFRPKVKQPPLRAPRPAYSMIIGLFLINFQRELRPEGAGNATVPSGGYRVLRSILLRPAMDEPVTAGENSARICRGARTGPSSAGNGAGRWLSQFSPFFAAIAARSLASALTVYTVARGTKAPAVHSASPGSISRTLRTWAP